ncbi:universal stress protein [Streptomyces sp. NPDC048481]|uniref:universal stress protein n=1 Tax=Streptomyces sp. NPDC048481 TaxID=3365557 RepID=UPI003720CD97
MEPVVTVGLDGSPESLAAARWAADEAAKRRLTLRLLHAWPLLSPEPAHATSAVDQNYWAKRLVHTARAEAQARHPGLTVVGSLVADDAHAALLKAASESEMTVLGSHGMGGVESYFMGEVSMPVVAHAPCPVVLVRGAGKGRHGGVDPGPGGRVVVAVKLNGSCEGLLDFAFHSAAAREVPLVVAHGRSVPLHARVPWGVDHQVTEEMTKDAQHELDRVLEPWRGKYPQVEVVESIRLASAAKVGVQASEGAGLLIVGRRAPRHSGATHLGPVAHAAIHHGRCPIAVVPHD